LEVRLVAEEPDLVRAHLKARGADSAEMLASVDDLGVLTKQRAALIREGDQARGDRKRLSAEIGSLLKAAGKGGGESEAVVALKAEVEAANQVDGGE
jgi:seryl-tRNA synthetase